MSRFKLGVALGGAAVYFFDPQQGDDRRRRVQSLWRNNRGAALELQSGASRTAESMRPLVRRVRRGLAQRNWTEDAGSNWVAAATGIAVATAIGGALVYFLDPQKGLVRRLRVRTFVADGQDAVSEGFRSVQKAAQDGAGEVAQAAEDLLAIGRG